MTDVLTPEQRKFNMSQIRCRNTKPELIVRHMIHSLSFRYRLHRTDLPGKPDLVFPSLKKAIFVHGCFWHMHNCRYGRVKPATNPTFWESKRQSNKRRDSEKKRELQRMGWDVLVIWECRTKNDLKRLHKRILSFLSE